MNDFFLTFIQLDNDLMVPLCSILIYPGCILHSNNIPIKLRFHMLTICTFIYVLNKQTFYTKCSTQTGVQIDFPHQLLHTGFYKIYISTCIL